MPDKITASVEIHHYENRLLVRINNYEKNRVIGATIVLDKERALELIQQITTAIELLNDEPNG